MGIRIISLGSYLPSTIETIQDQAAPGDNQGQELTGIHTRRVCQQHETPIYMGIQAAKIALANAVISPHTIDVVLSYSGVEDHITPKGVYGMLDDIGCNGAMAWPIDTACTSFISHLHCANALSLLRKKRFLIIESMNVVNRAFSKEDRGNGPGSMVGDAAGVAIVDAEPGRGCLIDIIEKTNSLDFDFLKMNSAQVTGNRESLVFTKSHKIIRRASSIAPETALELLERNGLTGRDINWSVSNQPGINAVHRWHEMAGIPLEKNLNTYYLYGNMLAANIPVTLNHFLTIDPKIKRGDIILVFAVGAGIHCAAALIEY